MFPRVKILVVFISALDTGNVRVFIPLRKERKTPKCYKMLMTFYYPPPPARRKSIYATGIYDRIKKCFIYISYNRIKIWNMFFFMVSLVFRTVVLKNKFYA